MKEGETVSQWMDTDAVRSLAESLMAPVPVPKKSAPESAYSDEFVGFAGGPEESMEIVTPPEVMESARRALSQARQNASSSGALPERANERAESLKKVVETPKPVEQTKPSEPAPHVAHPKPIIQPKKEAVKAPEPIIKKAIPAKPQVVRTVSAKPLREATLPPRKDLTAPAQKEPIPAPVQKAPTPDPLKPKFDSPFKIAAVQPAKPKPVESKPEVRDVPMLEVSSRLDAFGEWLKRTIPTTSYFLCDPAGKIFVDTVGSEKLVKVAQELARSSDGKSGLHVKVGPDRVMEVIESKGPNGPVILGAIVPRPLSAETSSSVADALEISLDEDLKI